MLDATVRGGGADDMPGARPVVPAGVTSASPPRAVFLRLLPSWPRYQHANSFVFLAYDQL
jgi:hypothetical protein